ncbi:MAG: DUF1801 domain-containing protein [Acidimicrobiia bacterium]
MARIGTFDELLAEADEAVRPVASALRAMVLDVHPDAVEVVRLGDRAATYGVGPKKMSEGHTYVMPQSSWVNLGFYHGAALPDPDGRLEGTGARLRHVKVRSVEGARGPALRALVEAALAERRVALG